MSTTVTIIMTMLMTRQLKNEVESGDQIALLTDKLYYRELKHESSELVLQVKEDVKVTFFSYIAPGKYLPLSIESAAGQTLVCGAAQILGAGSDDIYNGYFSDSDVSDRSLADWEGEWQSVYPYLLAGSLDKVLQTKAEKNPMTFEEYKDYYTVGYKTDVDTIKIKGDEMTFKTQASKVKAEYKYDGYKILQYKKGNRGVRFLFTKLKGDNLASQSVKFSDHAIAPHKAGHFHIYFGNESHDVLLQEMDNWPTYYPEEDSKAQIIEDMLAH